MEKKMTYKQAVILGLILVIPFSFIIILLERSSPEVMSIALRMSILMNLLFFSFAIIAKRKDSKKGEERRIS